MIHIPTLLVALTIASPALAQTSADESFQDRAMRSFARIMAVVEHCEMEIVPVAFARILEHGTSLRERLQMSEERASEIAQEELSTVADTLEDCDADNPKVALAQQFINDQTVLPVTEEPTTITDQNEAVELLGGLFVAVSLIEHCEIGLEPEVAAEIGNQALRLETLLSLDANRSEELYQRTLSQVRASDPDCDPDGEDLAPLNAMLDDIGAG